MAENAGASYSTDPALYIYTSLTAGSSHIVTATSRLETILRANRVPFKALDIATDDKARMLWGRRAGKDEGGRMRKLPALVQMGMVLGDLVEIEEWNEYGELKEHVTIYYDDFTIPPKNQAPPPVAMRPLNQPFPKSGVAPSSASSAPSAATTAATATSPPAPAPPAPPLPTDKDKAKIPLSSPTSAGPTKKVVDAAASAATPIRSLAEEAAQKAKKVQLDRLREKVHGKKDVPSKEKENEKPDAKSASTTPAKPKEDTKKESKKDSKKDSKKESKDPKTDTKKDTKKDSKKDSKKELSKESKKEPKKEPKELKKDSKKDTKKESKKDSKDPKKSLKKDPKKDPKKDVKKDSKKESKKDSKKDTSATDAIVDSMSDLTIGSEGSAPPAGLQSPTTGKWRSGISSTGGAQPQSPTTGTWKAGSIAGVITEHRGSVVVSAPEEEIAAIEKAEAIPEATSTEEEDSEDEEEEESEEEDEEEEEEEDDDEDDEDEEDSDEEESEEEDSEDEVEKVKAKK
ncbi:hypothetical protein F5Y07DRAFT_315400 [Xylaria sp. FL0933]|nr:hypothetical protein F5Y07DRAFT_315400 [Xylaria sp. FL0933]